MRKRPQSSQDKHETKLSGSPDDDAPKRSPVAEVKAMRWSPAATLVLAGVMEGADAASLNSKDKESGQVVTKHGGKAFGASFVANAAQRNGLARWAFSRAMPLDDTVRLFDTLATLPKMEIFSVNQLDLEKEIRLKQLDKNKQCGRQQSGDKGNEGAEITNTEIMYLEWTPIELASKLLFDALHKNTIKLEQDTSVWDLASTEGIPMKLAVKTFWYNWRQMWFYRRRARESLPAYGADENAVWGIVNKHAEHHAWKNLFDYFVEKKAAYKDEDNSKIYLRSSPSAATCVGDRLQCKDALPLLEARPSLES